MAKVHSEVEKEMVIYAKITKPEGLKLAKSQIAQEQANIKTPLGSIRVRMEKKLGNENWRYEMTTKVKADTADASIKSMTEDTTMISENVYEMFKRVVPDYMRKVRYIFPIEKAFVTKKGLSAELDIEDLFYEVDVFLLEDGTPAPWCKIDVEVGKLAEQLQAAGVSVQDFDIVARTGSLPLGLESAFVDTGEQSGPLRDLVSAIYSTCFLRKNTGPKPFVMPHEQALPEGSALASPEQAPAQEPAAEPAQA